jgi:hypothetical protein
MRQTLGSTKHLFGVFKRFCEELTAALWHLGPLNQGIRLQGRLVSLLLGQVLGQLPGHLQL